MISLQIPEGRFRTRTKDQKKYIFDPVRRRFVFLSPEEWVRQHLISYLTGPMKYPPSLLSVEKELRLGEETKRCDIVVYDRSGAPWMIVECKQWDEPLGEKVLQQAIRYHLAITVKYLLISNGRDTFCIGLDPVTGHRYLEALPDLE